LELGWVPEFKGEAFGLAFLAEPPLPLELLAIAGEEKQTLAVGDRMAEGLEVLEPLLPKPQAALPEPPAPSVGSVENLTHQHPQGSPAA
jgi:hypothetical protein